MAFHFSTEIFCHFHSKDNASIFCFQHQIFLCVSCMIEKRHNEKSCILRDLQKVSIEKEFTIIELLALKHEALRKQKLSEEQIRKIDEQENTVQENIDTFYHAILSGLERLHKHSLVSLQEQGNAARKKSIDYKHQLQAIESEIANEIQLMSSASATATVEECCNKLKKYKRNITVLSTACETLPVGIFVHYCQLKQSLEECYSLGKVTLALSDASHDLDPVNKPKASHSDRKVKKHSKALHNLEPTENDSSTHAIDIEVVDEKQFVVSRQSSASNRNGANCKDKANFDNNERTAIAKEESYTKGTLKTVHSGDSNEICIGSKTAEVQVEVNESNTSITTISKPLTKQSVSVTDNSTNFNLERSCKQPTSLKVECDSSNAEQPNQVSQPQQTKCTRSSKRDLTSEHANDIQSTIRDPSEITNSYVNINIVHVDKKAAFCITKIKSIDDKLILLDDVNSDIILTSHNGVVSCAKRIQMKVEDILVLNENDFMLIFENAFRKMSIKHGAILASEIIHLENTEIMTGSDFDGTSKIAISTPFSVLIYDLAGSLQTKLSYGTLGIQPDVSFSVIKTTYDFNRNSIYILNTEKKTTKRFSFETNSYTWRKKCDDDYFTPQCMYLWRTELFVLSKNCIVSFDVETGEGLDFYSTDSVFGNCLTMCIMEPYRIAAVTSESDKSAECVRIGFVRIDMSDARKS